MELCEKVGVKYSRWRYRTSKDSDFPLLFKWDDGYAEPHFSDPLKATTDEYLNFVKKSKNNQLNPNAIRDDSLRCIDLFAGAGGLSEGLAEAGFHSLFAVEVVPTYAQTYEFNHRGAQVTTADIRTLDAEDIRKRLGIEQGELDLIAGGPPCQGYSINAPVRSVLDHRNHLFKEYLRELPPSFPNPICHDSIGPKFSIAS